MPVKLLLPAQVDFKARIARSVIIGVRVLGNCAITSYVGARPHFVSRNISQIAAANRAIPNIWLGAWEICHRYSFVCAERPR